LLDELYEHVADAVPQSTLGRVWALRDLATGELYKEMGRSWANRNLNRQLDARPLQDVGIKAGMKFEAVRLADEHSS
jgi:hypothetical protein